ncbi:hypothetical protein BTO06_01150 [Tenacibaculum sp. SZ-18]|uniref:TlpA disulfide reductase family protein n=1 Tax=Tenacibaculum sp. SZ-18 TaxID=754423 RepID=UPI000C2D37A9|nr:TlpA disulfide reductase family protein [Tenacibaculum sp. SZ-18]AUC13841.1 hypothetical protein BTO06_01150 [Tenacibaculum sp. SZ-18]
MKKNILIFTLVLINCSKTDKTDFLLKGITKGIKDKTPIYLKIENQTIDSTNIENNTFFFQTKKIEFPVEAVLRINNPPQYKSIWLENKEILFDASKTEFIKYAKITGSETQKTSDSLYQEIKKLSYKESLKKGMSFVKNNPKNILSANLLSFYSTTWGRKKTKELFNPMSIENKNSIYGRQISNYLKLNKNFKISDKFVDFEMEDQFGLKKRLSDLKNKVILLEFWSSWCSPCREENPNLVKTYRKFKDKGFEIFAVSVDNNKSSWLRAIKKDSLEWIHVNDHLKGDRNVASLIYGTYSLPDNFLISKSGDIIARNLRGKKLNEKLNQIFE